MEFSPIRWVVKLWKLLVVNYGICSHMIAQDIVMATNLESFKGELDSFQDKIVGGLQLQWLCSFPSVGGSIPLHTSCQQSQVARALLHPDLICRLSIGIWLAIVRTEQKTKWSFSLIKQPGLVIKPVFLLSALDCKNVDLISGRIWFGGWAVAIQENIQGANSDNDGHILNCREKQLVQQCIFSVECMFRIEIGSPQFRAKILLIPVVL